MAIKSRDDEIAQYALMNKAEADALQSANDKLNSFWRSPYLWVVVGLGVGVYIGKK